MERIRSAVLCLWPVLSFRRGVASACATDVAGTGAKRSRLQAKRLEEAYFATKRATTATPHDAWPFSVLKEVAALDCSAVLCGAVQALAVLLKQAADWRPYSRQSALCL